MNKQDYPSFDGKVELSHIIRISELANKKYETALRIGDQDAAAMYRYKSETYDQIADTIVQYALLPVTDILQLPSITNRMLPISSTIIPSSLIMVIIGIGVLPFTKFS